MAQPVCGFLQLMDAPGGARRQFQVSMHSQGCGGGDGGSGGLGDSGSDDPSDVLREMVSNILQHIAPEKR